eukprot:2535-Heterococcus_DN1.PRE.2
MMIVETLGSLDATVLWHSGHALAVQAQTCGGTQQCAYKSSAMILLLCKRTRKENVLQCSAEHSLCLGALSAEPQLHTHVCSQPASSQKGIDAQQTAASSMLFSSELIALLSVSLENVQQLSTGAANFQIPLCWTTVHCRAHKLLLALLLTPERQLQPSTNPESAVV